MRLWSFVLCCILLVPLALAAPKAAPGGGALVEAKRKAANDLFREGKVDEAVALMLEVVRADKTNYKDFMLLARANDKLNRSTEATEYYRQVADLIGTSPSSPEDRAAKAECDRRLRVLDAQNAKLRALEEEFLKKLEMAEREAAAAKDASALRRIFRMKGAIYLSQNRKDRTVLELEARDGWQDNGFQVQAGRNYRIRAAGSYWIAPKIQCTADGTSELPPVNNAPRGALMAVVIGTTEFTRIGSGGRYTPSKAGKLGLMTNWVQPERPESGSLTVIVEEE